ncbi:DNA alkylation repair protein [Streptomyces mirabilis]|uniref:DNA alkylation repair protein n=1 Tax=Streptomyces mirabilis TaxID=68239 RepID=UPI0036850400
MSREAEALADSITAELVGLANAEYARGVLGARSPGKEPLGVAIPRLRAAVRTQWRRVRHLDGGELLTAADVLWRGSSHEQELAGCMLLRLSGTLVGIRQLRGWAPLLDNWLSVDELAGCLGEAIETRPELLQECGFLALDTSPWARRLYLAGVIRPVSRGLSAAAVPHLAMLFEDNRHPVRKASVWLLRATLKARPAAASEFAAVQRPGTPASLARMVEAALVAEAATKR